MNEKCARQSQRLDSVAKSTSIPWIGEVIVAAPARALQHPAVSFAACVHIRRLVVNFVGICIYLMAFFMALVPRPHIHHTIPFILMHSIAFVLALIYKAAPVIKFRKALSGMTEFSPALGSIPRRVLLAVAQTRGTPTFLPFLKTCGQRVVLHSGRAVFADAWLLLPAWSGEHCPIRYSSAAF